MQSYEKRFAGHEEEIKRDLVRDGVMPVMEKWGAKDYARFNDYATRLRDGKNTPVVNPARLVAADEVFRRLGVEVLRQLQAKDQEIHMLRTQLNARETLKQQEELEVKESVLKLLELVGAR